ncbi:hypothetical protein ACFLVZ_03540, partial [Chloroflexota bacterium]
IPAVVGLSMIWWAITLFIDGSIIWGILVLIIGTPIAAGIAPFLFFIGIIAAIIWGILNLFGLNVSFSSAWDIVWSGLKILLLGGIAIFTVASFVGAVKQKEIKSFFKQNWFWIILFFVFLWLFF